MPSNLTLIEATGEVGEARLVARQLRAWLAAGVAPADIVVAARDLPAKEPLLREVFDEYAVPCVWAVPEPVARCGALRLLRRVWPLARQGFPFRSVAAVWRNNYFRPAFEPDRPLMAESLLRQLNVPRGRVAILEAVHESAEDRRPLPLEDETMEKSRRDQRSQLAKLCLGFYQWFFGLWQAISATGTAEVYAQEFWRLAKEMGILKAPLPGADDAAAMSAFGAALDEWAIGRGDARLTADEFDRALADIASTTAWPKSELEFGVRVLPAAEAPACTHLILLGLGEGSFPKPEQFEADRVLFESLLGAPTQALVLARPALDTKGQELLPSLFLAEIKLITDSIPTVTQTMLLDRYLTEPAISEAEQRVQFAAKPAGSLNLVCRDNLAAAKKMAAARFGNEAANAYCGVLADEKVVAAIATQFGSRHLFSPTSLENYIGCPFRFWAQKVLGLEELDEPTEEVDVSRRGSALHRALSRFHGANPQERPDSAAKELDANWSQVVAESADRTPSPAGKVLWRLEQRRMQRSLNRYNGHWSEFRGGWRKRGANPVPDAFEAMFGYDKPGAKPALTLEVDGVQVRIGGIIDRVDLATIAGGHGFWIIDYKSGGTIYSGRELQNFERLQLPLYALAVERVFHREGTARPLGMAYWLLAKDGPKRMMPDKRQEFAWLDSRDAWAKYSEQMARVVATVAISLRAGDFRLAPRRKETCQYCECSTICRINQMRDRITPLAIVEDEA